jgi:hypothetical protein
MRRKLRDTWSTLGLLYQMDRSAFLISTSTSVIQSLIYPIMLLIIWKGFSLILSGAGDGSLIRQGALLLGGLLLLLVIETLLQVANETAASILRAESSQQVSARIMRKMGEIPYRLFEDNAFQARYGLLISQASYQPGLLVQAFVGSMTSLVSSLAIAATLFALAPILNVFLLVLIPLTIVETRYRTRTLEFQTHAAPELFRMTYLTQKSIDATWQRDIRVHHSTILNDEYRVLSRGYLSQLKHLLGRYLVVRAGVGIGGAAVLTLAMAVVFWQVAQSAEGPAEAVILLPALLMGMTQGRAFADACGALAECLGYLAQVFDFLDQSFDPPEPIAARPADLTARVPTAA